MIILGVEFVEKPGYVETIQGCLLSVMTIIDWEKKRTEFQMAVVGWLVSGLQL